MGVTMAVTPRSCALAPHGSSNSMAATIQEIRDLNITAMIEPLEPVAPLEPLEPLDYSQLLTDLLERVERELQFVMRVRGRHDRPDARFALGHRRERDALREHALGKQSIRQR